MWKTMGEINCATQIEAMLNRPNRNNRVWPEGAWVTYEHSDRIREEIERNIRSFENHERMVTIDAWPDFNDCQTASPVNVEDLL